MRGLYFALIAAALGCSSGPDALDSKGVENPEVKAISIFPEAVYVGVEDNGTRYSAPIAITSGRADAWSSSDPAVATVSGTASLGQISALKTGTADVHIRSGEQSATASVTVLSYRSQDRIAGERAYDQFGCGGCHGSGDPDITPSGIGKHSDEEIQGAFTKALNPEGGPLRLSSHKFPVAPSDPAYVGLVAYLRSQPAAGVPHRDTE